MDEVDWLVVQIYKGQTELDVIRNVIYLTFFKDFGIVFNNTNLFRFILTNIYFQILVGGQGRVEKRIALTSTTVNVTINFTFSMTNGELVLVSVNEVPNVVFNVGRTKVPVLGIGKDNFFFNIIGFIWLANIKKTSIKEDSKFCSYFS